MSLKMLIIRNKNGYRKLHNNVFNPVKNILNILMDCIIHENF